MAYWQRNTEWQREGEDILSLYMYSQWQARNLWRSDLSGAPSLPYCGAVTGLNMLYPDHFNRRGASVDLLLIPTSELTIEAHFYYRGLFLTQHANHA